MKKSIYIQALEIGFANELNGISFDEVVAMIGIEEKIKDLVFMSNFTIWFYTNFFNHEGEANLKINNSGTSSYIINPDTLKDLERCKTEKSFIKGEATQKYIDYLELKEARESAQTARRLSIYSIGIAMLAIMTPYMVNTFVPDSPKQVVVIENRDNSNDLIYQKLTEIDSTINLVVKEFNQPKLKQLVVTAPKK